MKQNESETLLNPDRDALRLFAERMPNVCLFETNREGTVTWIGKSAEDFFGYAPHEVIGKLNYKDFHTREEMEACKDDPEFKRQVSEQGWTENEWTVIPKTGDSFRAVVTLVRKTGKDPAGGEREDESKEAQGGWISLYRRLGDLSGSIEAGRGVKCP